MPGPTMTAEELAAEIGRQPTWVYRHWRGEVAAKRLPPPLHNGKAPLAWSRAHVYAVLDKQLTAAQRAIAAAFRAAAAAADGVAIIHNEERVVSDYRIELDRIYAPQEAAE